MIFGELEYSDSKNGSAAEDSDGVVTDGLLKVLSQHSVFKLEIVGVFMHRIM
jgi:hypothetical protein